MKAYKTTLTARCFDGMSRFSMYTKKPPVWKDMIQLIHEEIDMIKTKLNDDRHIYEYKSLGNRRMGLRQWLAAIPINGVIDPDTDILKDAVGFESPKVTINEIKVI